MVVVGVSTAEDDECDSLLLRFSVLVSGEEKGRNPVVVVVVVVVVEMVVDDDDGFLLLLVRLPLFGPYATDRQTGQVVFCCDPNHPSIHVT